MSATDRLKESRTSMRQMMYDHIDQLDLALDQLAQRDRNFDRFAIMLVDNVVELALHRHALDKKRFGASWLKSDAPQFNPKLLADAVGPKFDAKVSFALQTGLLTKPMSQSIKWLHSFRNTSYHAGLRHEGVLHSLANFYVRICCELLTRYRPPYWSSGREQMSHRVAKYLGGSEGARLPFSSIEQISPAWQRLKAVAENMKCDLIADLRHDLADTIDQVDECIGFYVENAPHPSKYSRDEVVVEAQIWPLAFSKDGVQYAERHGFPGQPSYGPALARWLRENYKAPVPLDPIPKWRERLGSLGREKDEHSALEKYCNFLAQTLSFRDDIARQNEALWNHIEEQIDRAKEDRRG